MALEIIHTNLSFTVETDTWNKLPHLIAERIKSFGLDPAHFQVSMTATQHQTPIGPRDIWEVEVSTYTTDPDPVWRPEY